MTTTLVNKYLENYDRALAGFEAAALKDPSLNASEEVEKMVNLLNKLEILLRMDFRKQLASLQYCGKLNCYWGFLGAKRSPELDLNQYQGIFLSVILRGISHPTYCPVYGIRNDAIKEGDQLTLLEPHFRNIDFSWKGKCYKFKSIRVDFLEQVLVNGKALPPHQAIRTSIYAQHKP
ncbi:hypothetical protein GOBAR_AA35064 [Gossypium barbadense]|uniref:Tetratricopeptide repeat protein 5 OB fold domain-containing protein n=1 Tax=Gossypium barbadense TaxID=3634 RepID=A0A2P5W3J8_GOSBA|nr:hypothetical protein GOBAR_AA35064 [Gossypium barbadense]